MYQEGRYIPLTKK